MRIVPGSAGIHRLLTAVTLMLVASLSGDADASVQYRIQQEAIAPLSAPISPKARVRIEGIPIDGTPEALDLEAFEVFTKDAEIRVMGANEEVLEVLAPPAMRLYRGGIAGDPDSLVFLSVGSSRVEGVVFKGDRRFGIGSRVVRSKAQRPQVDVFVQESDISDDFPSPGEEFFCEVENSTISRKPTLSSVVKELQPVAQGALSTASARWVINMAIETDYELYVNSGSNSTNVNTFIANLIGAMSTIYNRELTAEVQIAYLGIHTSAADPFTVVPGQAGTWNGNAVTYSSLHALLEFGDRWHNSPPSANARSTTALISGKSQMSGVAWVDVLCDSDFFFSTGQPEPYRLHYGGRYSFNGGIDPPPDLSVPNPDANAPVYTVPSSNYWPLLQVAHETGHNVFSGHTHCRVLPPADQVTYGRMFVDTCYNGEAGNGCYGGANMIPPEKGTIMSYCHLFGGTNSRFIFGKTGEASYVVPQDMKTAIQNVTPNLSAITAPASLASGASGTASVTNVAGVTYLWTITNGTINSGQGTNSINFTATADPTVVRVKATNAAGCSITDSKSVTVGASYNAPTNVVATATSATSVSVTWSAPGSGTTPVQYDVYRSSNGTSYAQIGFATHPTLAFTDSTASANTAYLYKVRSAGSGGANESADSNRDLATTVIFTDDPLVAGVTPIKTVHITQLRTAVNAVRTLAGLSAASFTDPTLVAGTTKVKAAHLTELRSNLDAARAVLTLPALSYGESITTTTTVKASHVTELRNGVK